MTGRGRAIDAKKTESRIGITLPGSRTFELHLRGRRRATGPSRSMVGLPQTLSNLFAASHCPNRTVNLLSALDAMAPGLPALV